MGPIPTKCGPSYLGPALLSSAGLLQGLSQRGLASTAFWQPLAPFLCLSEWIGPRRGQWKSEGPEHLVEPQRLLGIVDRHRVSAQSTSAINEDSQAPRWLPSDTAWVSSLPLTLCWQHRWHLLWHRLAGFQGVGHIHERRRRGERMNCAEARSRFSVRISRAVRHCWMRRDFHLGAAISRLPQ